MSDGMVVGYARTSTADQEAGLEAQERDLRAAGCKKLYTEQVSATERRPRLEAALDYTREGDVLVVTKPDRLARSTADLLAIVARLESKGVALRILSMGGGAGGLDTRDPTNRFMLTMLGAVAEFERNLMRERQKEASPRPRPRASSVAASDRYGQIRRDPPPPRHGHDADRHRGEARHRPYQVTGCWTPALMRLTEARTSPTRSPSRGLRRRTASAPACPCPGRCRRFPGGASGPCSGCGYAVGASQSNRAGMTSR